MKLLKSVPIEYINKGRESIDMLPYIGKTLAMAVNSLNSPIFYEAVVVEMRFVSITHSIGLGRL